MQITWFVVLPCSDTKSVYGWLQPLYRLPKEQHALICLEEAVKMGSLQGLSFIETVPRKLTDYAILFLQKESLSTITCPCTCADLPHCDKIHLTTSWK